MVNSKIEGFRFDCFKKHKRLQHFVSFRNGGASKGNYFSLNLSYNCGDNSAFVCHNRKLISELFNILPNKLYIPEQCHTNNIAIIKQSEAETDLTETDGLITNLPNICIGVLAADCVPILMYDPTNSVIAALHAGWRGTVTLIQKKAIEIIINEFGSNKKNILVGIGPCISQVNYEVGKEVVEKFNAVCSNTNSFITQKNNKGYINLAEANRKILIQNGILPSNVEVSNLCSFNNKKQFFSARRDGFNTGRFGSFIMLKEPT